MSKPSKTIQLLRGARLALQHYKDLHVDMPFADAEFVGTVHRAEYRKLSFVGRIAYKNWTAE